MADLKTNYKDDVLDTSKNEKRKFRMIQNDDGTVSFDDATEYAQQGDDFGAADINATNAKINEQSQSLTAENGTKFRFGQNSEGEYGYIVNKDGADTVIPFNGKKDLITIDGLLNNGNSPKLIDMDRTGKCTITCSLQATFLTVKLNDETISMKDMIGYDSGIGTCIGTCNFNKGDVLSIANISKTSTAYVVCY